MIRSAGRLGSILLWLAMIALAGRGVLPSTSPERAGPPRPDGSAPGPASLAAESTDTAAVFWRGDADPTGGSPGKLLPTSPVAAVAGALAVHSPWADGTNPSPSGPIRGPRTLVDRHCLILV